MPIRESIYDLVTRVENVIDSQESAAGQQTVDLDVSDVERLMHAAIWGDDA